ncbi:MAG TPA: hypothetical protein VFN34_05710 [Ornithinibacter sp.]|nr:hypothetical protein [Ornithinibacter sp.]
MRRLLTITITAVIALFLFNPMASAGSPHFVGGITVERSGDSLTVSGKEAGLGNEEQVHIVVSATALCINGGGKHPKAVNKGSFSDEGDFPVQNGKANFSLTLTATFQPDCSPPMSVAWTDVTVEDTTNGISQSFPGTF